MKHSISLLLVTAALAAVPSSGALPPANVEPAAKASNQLAFDLYRKTTTHGSEDLVFSPLSIETAMAMASAGAKGETLTQMAHVLHFAAFELPPDPNASPSPGPTKKKPSKAEEEEDTTEKFPLVHAGFKELLGELKGDQDFQLTIVNKLWGAQSTEYLRDFMTQLKKNYGAELTPLNFKDDADASRQKINEWVEQQTEGKIKDLMRPGTITAASDLVITNAIYFKGKWVTPFEKRATLADDFHVTPQKTTKTDFMHKKAHYKYAENPELQMLEMPYQGNRMVMDVLLPKAGNDLAGIDKKLNAKAIDELTQSLQSYEVQVALPKFKTESELSLATTLGTLGMWAAFTPRKSDFGRIRKFKPGENMYISAVVHKAFIEVDEAGTEAAAATAVSFFGASIVRDSNMKKFNADHPFEYLIRDVKSGAILFMGRYEGT